MVIYPTILLGCLALLVKHQFTFLFPLNDAAGVTACQMQWCQNGTDSPAFSQKPLSLRYLVHLKAGLLYGPIYRKLLFFFAQVIIHIILLLLLLHQSADSYFGCQKLQCGKWSLHPPIQPREMKSFLPCSMWWRVTQSFFGKSA